MNTDISHRPGMRIVSCGCCTDGCCCHFHQDIRYGIHVKQCAFHAANGHPHTTSPISGRQWLARRGLPIVKRDPINEMQISDEDRFEAWADGMADQDQDDH